MIWLMFLKECAVPVKVEEVHWLEHRRSQDGKWPEMKQRQARDRQRKV